jgi:glucose 1-dehydrogenase
MAAPISISQKASFVRVLVTGVSEGIGGAICRQIANEPDSAVAIRLSRTEVEALAAELQGRGCKTLVIEGDLRNPSRSERFVEAAVSQFKGLDAIVSTAGAVDPTSLEAMSLQVWDEMFAPAYRARWLLAKAGFSHLKASQSASSASRRNPGCIRTGKPGHIAPQRRRSS